MFWYIQYDSYILAQILEILHQEKHQIKLMKHGGMTTMPFFQIQIS